MKARIRMRYVCKEIVVVYQQAKEKLYFLMLSDMKGKLKYNEYKLVSKVVIQSALLLYHS